jgi:hypothetical protein
VAHEGRIQGRISEDGQFYELVQADVVRQRIPIADAHADDKMQRAIQRNGWEALR